MRNFLALTCCSFLIAACASSSGVMDMGNGNFRVSASAFTSMGSTGAAERQAADDAKAWCKSRGLSMQATDDKSDANIAEGNVTLTFKCVATGS